MVDNACCLQAMCGNCAEVKMRPSRVGHEQYHDHGEDIVIQNEV